MREAMRYGLISPFATLLFFLAACGGPNVTAEQVVLELPLDFEGNDQLEVSVFLRSTTTCGAITPLTVGDIEPREGRQIVAAGGLNGDSGSISLGFEDLPAEQPLVFYARVVRDGDAIATDCSDNNIVINEGERLAVRLVVAE